MTNWIEKARTIVKCKKGWEWTEQPNKGFWDNTGDGQQFWAVSTIRDDFNTQMEVIEELNGSKFGKHIGNKTGYPTNMRLNDSPAGVITSIFDLDSEEIFDALYKTAKEINEVRNDD